MIEKQISLLSQEEVSPSSKPFVSDVPSEFLKAISYQIGDPPVRVTLKTTGRDLQFDPLDSVEFIMNIEDELLIEISDSHVTKAMKKHGINDELDMTMQMWHDLVKSLVESQRKDENLLKDPKWFCQ